MSTVYLQYFGLKESPFSITPDPSFVYLSAAHRDALAHLLYGVGQGGAGGFVQLTGEVGTGKTTLCRCLIEQVEDNTQIALILNPLMTPLELLASIGEELGIEVADLAHSSKALVDALNKFLLDQHAQGKRVVVVIDEAQNLSPEALEQVRLLTNLETSKNKLLQMVLLGQPELRQLLQRQNLRQLSQRITARYHLAPLDAEETVSYVSHRMKVAGAIHNPFRRSALKALYQRSHGIPRLINIIADRALAGAYARESRTVNAALVNQAANEVQPSEPRVGKTNWPWVIGAGLAAMLILAMVFVFEFGWPTQVGNDEISDLATITPELAAPSTNPLPEPIEKEPEQSTGEKRDSVTLVTLEDSLSDTQKTESVPAGGLSSDSSIESSGQFSAPVFDDDWLLREHRNVWQGLAELWDDPENGQSIQAACDGEKGTGYACLPEQGNIARIQRLGFPVLMVLQTIEPSYLLLRGVIDGHLLVGSEEQALRVPAVEIEQYWLGDFVVVWPQADDWPQQIRRGQSGMAVDIVMDMARLADPPWRGSGLFDADFESWLILYQRRQGLLADGIVGPNTLVYLMAPTISKPRLIMAEDGES